MTEIIFILFCYADQPKNIEAFFFSHPNNAIVTYECFSVPEPYITQRPRHIIAFKGTKNTLDFRTNKIPNATVFPIVFISVCFFVCFN